MKKILSLMAVLISQMVMAHPKGIVVVAGGGDEGAPGDKSAWNYSLYEKLVKNGDTNGDKKVKVVVMSYYKQDDHYQKTFSALGADEVDKIELTDRKMSSDPKVLMKIKEADVVFFRGGDQAEYYKNIKDTPFKKELLKLKTRGGAFGGTSAGAMSLAEYSLAGGQELGSDDILSDAHSPLLQDAFQKTKSSIKNDFLGIVPNVTIDTHCGERARLGRILGVHAKASEDYKKKDILGICVSEQTGIAISDGKAEVFGNGVVEVIRQTPETLSWRRKGKPLVYSDIELSAFTEGWLFDISTGRPDEAKLPKGAQLIKKKPRCSGIRQGAMLDGNASDATEVFEFTPVMQDSGFKLVRKYESPIRGAIGITKAQSYDRDSRENTEKAVKLAMVYRAFFEEPRSIAFLISDESRMTASNEIVGFVRPQRSKAKLEQSSIIIDCANCKYTSLSPRVSSLDNGSKTLRLATIVGARVHIIGNSADSGVSYNLKNHQVVNSKSKTEGDICVNCELASAVSSTSKAESLLIEARKMIETCEH